jgi:hypothetical protein
MPTPEQVGPYHAPCARCHVGHGHPKKVTTNGPDSVLVGVMCDACGHKWTITRTDNATGVPTFRNSDSQPA